VPASRQVPLVVFVDPFLASAPIYQLSGQIAVVTVVEEVLPPDRTRRESIRVTEVPSFQRYRIRRSSADPEIWTSGRRDRQVARSDDPLTINFHAPARGMVSSPAWVMEIQHARSGRRKGYLLFMGILQLEVELPGGGTTRQGACDTRAPAVTS
jgi:hypothetical protein